MPRIFKPNMQAMSEEAARAKSHMGSRESRDIVWFDWEEEGANGSDGWNYLRMLPPWSEAGKIGFLVYTWKLPHTQEKVRHLMNTWPDKGVEDPIEATLKKLLMEYPNLKDAIAEIKPKINAFVNVIDRKDEGAGPKLARFPISVYNWYQGEMQSFMARGIDPTDPTAGVDFRVKKSPKIDGWYDYSFFGQVTKDGLIPTISPLATDPAMADQWLDMLWALDRIFHFPDDATLAKYQNIADGLSIYFEREARKAGSKPPERPAELRTQAPKPEAGAPPAGTPEAAVAAMQAQMAPPAQVVPPKVAPPPVAGPPTAGTAPQSPTDKPACFQDHQPGHGRCMMCPCEFDCMDLAKQSRRPYAWDPKELANPER